MKLTVNDITEHYNISRQRVHQLMNEGKLGEVQYGPKRVDKETFESYYLKTWQEKQSMGTQTHPAPKTNMVIEALPALTEKGLTPKQIAAELGVASSLVYTAIHRAGLPINSKSNNLRNDIKNDPSLLKLTGKVLAERYGISWSTAKKIKLGG